MSKGIAITGMGILSAIGNNVEENYTSLIEGKKGIS
ncbi:MAG: 3-oxoacyl-[acyl-carrier-protein] synthase II, partial [Patiriisocius sp.]